MKFHRTPIALAVLTACSALPLVAQAAPSVSWTSPADGATLSGTVSGGACAVTTSSSATRVTFWADNWQINNDYSAPFNCDFPTTKLRDGAHKLRAVAYDASGASSEADINITINNSGTTTSSTTTSSTSTTTTSSTTSSSTTATPAPGSGSLDVWFKAPLNGATISGVLNGGTSCYVNGTGDSKVAFFLDNTALNTDTTMADGMQCVLDTTKFANGSHQLKAQAFNSSGSSRWDVITVNVQNAAVNAAPSVVMSAPASGATVSGTAVAFAANAADDAGVARVEFFLDSTALVSDTSAPYAGTFDSTKLANGTHVLKAVAYDAQGLSATSQVSINVQNAVAATGTSTGTTSTATPLSVVWAAPLNGATLSGTLSGSTCAANAGSAVTRMTFWAANWQINNDYSPPFNCSFDTTKLADGAYTLRAVAYDASGKTVESDINVTIANKSAPTSTTSTGTTGTTTPTTSTSTTATPAPGSGSLDVWFKAPANGATISGTLNGGTSCYVNGTSDAKVAFFMDSTALNTDTTMSDGMQCVLDTTKFANGSHQLKAQAFDASGNSRWDVISVNVQNAAANTAPTVSVTSPTSGATVSGTAMAYAASAADNAGVAKVDFFIDSTALVSDTTSPYGGALDTTKLANGTHVLKAVAYDAQGLSATSQISINVQNTTTSTGTTTGSTATPAPGSGTLDVWFKAPLAGATISGTLNGGTSCYVNGTGVAKVGFSLDSSALNTDSTMSDGMQCVLDTTKFANGTHQLTATAYDSAGNSRKDVISVNVQNALTGVNTTPTPTTTTGGSTSTTTPSSSTLPANGARAVPTFHSIGLYWTPPSNPGAGCPVIFRKSGDSAWRQGLDMWYDSRNNECRGSLVQLEPATTYEVQLGMPGQTPSAGLMVTTWSEQYPVAQVITLPAGTVTQPLAITQGGSASGYVVYQADPSGTTIDVQNAYDANVTISAPYVILRGVTLKNARINGVDLLKGAHDVVIEGNDISGWGRMNYTNSAGWKIGVDMDAGIRARCTDFSLERVVIQRNRIHDPRYGANSWDWGHPAGPQGITFSYCGGNHVIRYNEITSSDPQHFYNDGMGGEDNFTTTGFPNYDTDIYGNVIQGTYDDAIEAEGGDRNVRIWGNYLSQTGTGIASSVSAVGPLYIFRNVYNVSRKFTLKAADSDDRGPFFKAGSESSTIGDGRRYVFHNTALQAPNTSGTYPLGAGMGIAGNTGEPLTNTVIRNNIFHIWKSGWQSIDQVGGYANDANSDLYNGAIVLPSGNEGSGVQGTPTYASGNGYASGSGGMYQLAPGTPGQGTAMRIPNFNDAYAAPDVGAAQSGNAAMKFGVNQ